MERKCLCGKRKQIYKLVRKYCLVSQRQYYYSIIINNYYEMSLALIDAWLVCVLRQNSITEEYKWKRY